MKNLISGYKFLVVVVLLLAVTGCTVRNYAVVKERQDMKEQGNKGYITGTAPERTEPAQTTRTTYVWEVEFGKGSQVEGTKVEPTVIESPVVETKVEEAPVVIEVPANLK